jgi:hypothetical protein
MSFDCVFRAAATVSCWHGNHMTAPQNQIMMALRTMRDKAQEHETSTRTFPGTLEATAAAVQPEP